MGKLVIASSQFQSQVADLLPCNKWRRSQLVHGLIDCYSLLEKFDHVISKPYCDKRELLKFHAESYIDTLLNSSYNQLLPYDEAESSWTQLIEMDKDWSHRHDTKVTTHWSTRAQLYEHFQGLRSRKRSADEVDSNDTPQEIDSKVFNLEGDCPIFSYLPKIGRAHV